MAFRFGDPNLFVMGVVDQTLYDPNTGDVIGYDKLGNDVALNYTFDFTEITGFRNSLVMSIPQNTRLTGTYTSAAFSLNARALLTGSEIEYNAVGRVCEEITAAGTSLTVSRTPAKFYAQPASDTKGWAYIHEKGAAQYEGVRYYIDLTTGTVEDFAAVSGKTYEVVYFTEIASAQMLGLRNSANPSVVSILQKWGVYAAQNGSRANGTLQGYLHVVVPLAMLEGDAGIDGNQTSNSTSSYAWRALNSADNLPACDNCNDDSDFLAYYVFVPCGEATQDVEALAVVGAGVSVAVGATAQIPVKYVMPDNSLVQPAFADLDYESSATGKATVSDAGIVTGVATGDAEITITLEREGKPDLTAVCNVTVTA